MQKTIAAFLITGLAFMTVSTECRAQVHGTVLGHMPDRSCVATEYIKQESRLASLPEEAAASYSYRDRAKELNERKSEVFAESERVEMQRSELAWKAASEILAARPSMVERLKLAVLHDYPHLRVGGTDAQRRFNELYIRYAQVDPELLSAVHSRLNDNSQYDILMAETLHIGDRIDTLEGEQIKSNEAIPLHWDDQEKASLLAARAFAARAKNGERILNSASSNRMVRQTLAVAGALQAQRDGSLPDEFRPIQSEGAVIKGAVVGLPMAGVRSFIRDVDTAMRLGELKMLHIDQDKLGNAQQRAEMMVKPERARTRAAALEVLAGGIQQVAVANAATRMMQKMTIPPPPDLTGLPPQDQDTKAKQFADKVGAELKEKVSAVKKIFRLE